MKYLVFLLLVGCTGYQLPHPEDCIDGLMTITCFGSHGCITDRTICPS